jgi:hypothetical protein
MIMKWHRQYGVNDEHVFLVVKITYHRHQSLINVID